MRHLLLLLPLALALGCERPNLVEVQKADPNLPPVRLDLPDPPKVLAPPVPEAHPDGSFSVYGLRHGQEKFLGKDVTVRAEVQEVYRCPWAEEEAALEKARERARRLGKPLPKPKTDHPRCKHPHFFVGDPGRKKHRMLVVGYDPQEIEEPEPGSIVLITGTFSKESPEGFIAPDGLLRLKAWEPYPAPSK